MKMFAIRNSRRIQRLAAAAVAVALWTVWPAGVAGWGQTGHRVVAEIAQRHLTQRAADEVRRILDGARLAEVANWSDEIRSDPGWECASPFHYMTAEDLSRYPESGVPARGDAVGAILHYSAVLAEPGGDPESRSQALRFLVHFVGDLSQPLHCGKGCDAGGNQIRLLWFGDETNLHSVWDDRMLEARDLSYTEMVDFIDRGEARPGPEQVDPLAWIAQAQGLFPAIYSCLQADGCPCYCGECENGVSPFGGCGEARTCSLQVGGAVRLSWAYRRRHDKTLDGQLLAGGLRLASMLNGIFSDPPSEPESLRDLRRRFDATGDWRQPYRSCRP